MSLLTKVSDEVALGNYGKKVDVKSSDYEIAALSESFNSMSLAIEQKIKEIREESEKNVISFVADFTHEMKNSDDGYHRIRSNVTFLRPEYNGEKTKQRKQYIMKAKRLEKNYHYNYWIYTCFKMSR